MASKPSYVEVNGPVPSGPVVDSDGLAQQVSSSGEPTLAAEGSSKQWKGSSIVEIAQFCREDVETVISTAREMQKIVEDYGKTDLLKGRILANVFYEASTRTAASFHAAMLRLGGDVIHVASSSSSSKKGETLQDTLRCLECYSDVVVLRHPERGSAAIGADCLRVPLLNAGDGSNEHPTQAMLDIVTIAKELGQVDGLTITMCGDLKYGRTVHSLAKVLDLFDGITFNFVAPDELQLPQSYAKHLRSTAQFSEELSDTILSATDILYVTRLQKERFEDLTAYDRLRGSFVISTETLKHMKTKSAIMHPLPRVGEILEEVDADPRAAYFRQMKNGMYTRMALLKLVMLGK